MTQHSDPSNNENNIVDEAIDNFIDSNETPANVSNESVAEDKVKPAATRLLSSGLLVGLMTMISRVLGVIRDIVLASVLGGVASGGQAGAFYVAFKVPQFLRRLFAEGAFSQAFVPVLSEYQEKYNRQEVQALIDRVAGVLSTVLFVVVALVILGSPLVIYVVAPGFASDVEKFALTESLLRITFPYLLLISLAGFMGAILNSNNRFVAPAFTPVWLNIALISAGLWGTQWVPSVPHALAYGIVFAGIIQLVFLFPFVAKLGLFPKPKFDLSHPGVKKILKLMLPALLGVSVAQVNLVLDTVLATFLPDGSIAWLYFSQRLSDLPLGVFAIAISTVLLPGLSRQFSNNNVDNFAPIIDWGIRVVLLVGIPSVVALWVLAEPILSVLFLHGKTTLLDIKMSAYSLAAYSIGIVFFMMIKILVPGYFARQDMKTPVKIGIIAMIANIIFNFIFVYIFYTYYNLGHVGLALATSCSAMINVWLLIRGLKKAGIYAVQPGFWKNVFIFLFAAATMGALLWVAIEQYLDFVSMDVLPRTLSLLALCAVGAGCYFFVLYALGLRVRHFKQSV